MYGPNQDEFSTKVDEFYSVFENKIRKEIIKNRKSEYFVLYNQDIKNSLTSINLLSDLIINYNDKLKEEEKLLKISCAIILRNCSLTCMALFNSNCLLIFISFCNILISFLMLNNKMHFANFLIFTNYFTRKKNF